MSDPKVVILGGAGMLGHKLFQLLRQRIPRTRAMVHRDVRLPPLREVPFLQGDDVISGIDALGFAALRARLEELAPNVIVNCIGIIKQRDEAKKPIPSITLNALLPHRLAEAAQAWGGRVIHFSTDCVFSGRAGNYRETDPSDAEDLYGKSKFLGEVASSNAVTLRTSIIGRELSGRQSLLEWFLSQKGRRVRGYRRAIYSGVTTNEMANVVTKLITDHFGLTGLFQVVSEPISKYDLLRLVRDEYGLDVVIEPDDRELCDRSMRGDKFLETTGWRAPSWTQMVRAMAADPTPYDTWAISTS